MLVCTWKINQITKQNIGDNNNIILHIVWEKSGLDSDGNMGSCKSSTYFDTSEIDPSLFVPFEELTEEIVIQWIKSVINEDEINGRILEEINKSKSNWEQLEDGQFPWQVVRE